MNKGMTMFNLLLILTIVLAACSSTAPAQDIGMQDKPIPTDVMMEESKGDMAAEGNHNEAMREKMPEDAMDSMDKTPPMETAESMEMEVMDSMAVPSWFNSALTDVASGESFTLADFNGKVVLVETMAVWCSTCLRQQKQVKALHDLMGMRDDFVSVGLGIDPNEDAALLKGYIEGNGFDWVYAISSVEISREIGLALGDQFLNPPSAPMFIIDRKGQLHPLPFGVKSAEDLQKTIEPFLDEAM